MKEFQVSLVRGKPVTVHARSFRVDDRGLWFMDGRTVKAFFARGIYTGFYDTTSCKKCGEAPSV